MRENRIRRIEEQLSEIEIENLEGKTRVELWKEVLQGQRDRPEYYHNVERSDKVCELVAREDLDLEIPEELEQALEKEIETYRSAFKAAGEEEALDRDALEKEIRDICRKTPADWDFQKIMKCYNSGDGENG